MSPDPKTLPKLRLSFAAALLLGAAGCSMDPVANDAPPLAGATIGGPFTLTSQDGQTVSDQDFSGQYRIMYFGYTFCPDVCPVDLQKLAQGYMLFEKQYPARAARVQPIFITVDPERDSVEAIKAYVEAFHPRLIGLTGDIATITAVAKSFAVYFTKVEAEGASEYLVDHSRQAYLMDGNGKPLALLPVDTLDNGTPSSPQDVADALARWTGDLG